MADDIVQGSFWAHWWGIISQYTVTLMKHITTSHMRRCPHQRRLTPCISPATSGSATLALPEPSRRLPRWSGLSGWRMLGWLVTSLSISTYSIRSVFGFVAVFISSVKQLLIQECAVDWCGFTQNAVELFIQKALQNPKVVFKDYLVSPQPSESELSILEISNFSSLHMTLHQWSK